MTSLSNPNGPTTSNIDSDNAPGILDSVNNIMGMGAAPMEMDQSTASASTGQPHGGAPRRQISNLSLPQKKSDMAGTASNLVNSIVGAGIIGIPFALQQSGLVAGVLLLFLVSYFTREYTIPGIIYYVH
jgi:hypothetical protein